VHEGIDLRFVECAALAFGANDLLRSHRAASGLDQFTRWMRGAVTGDTVPWAAT
jgi:hypothetical protein